MLDGVVVRYRPDAIVRAEIPTSFEASETQHQRWELGRAQVARTFVPLLLRAAVRPRPRRPREIEPRRSTLVDAALDQVLPPLSLLVAAQGALVVAGLPARTRPARAVRAASIASVAVTVAHVAVGLRRAGAPRWVYRSLLGAPRMVAWKLALVVQMATGSRSTSWTRTERNAEGAPGREAGAQRAQGSE